MCDSQEVEEGMCGIVGCWEMSGEVRREVVEAMTSCLRHRGPDSSGIWIDEAAHLALGHTRLAILDLSPAGHQPMLSMCGRFVIVYNGEIYNHQEIRERLESEDRSIVWRGHSDTEVLLAAIRAWGVEAALQSVAGMFAFALWDRQAHCLTLARDRMGEKPLYYGWQGTTFLFASELKALHAHPAFQGRISPSGLSLYFQHSYVPTPYSIYDGIYKLPPGTYLQLRSPQAGVCPQPKQYWSLIEVALQGIESPFQGSEEEAVETLQSLLTTVVQQQMVADVPVGVFLSGGIDSSLVSAVAQAQSARPIRTFTIGFEEKPFDEATYARNVARHLGTDHCELYVTAKDAIDLVPYLPAVYDEPFADSSQIPTLLVSRLARSAVTVVLTGDGGDESTGGYRKSYDVAIKFYTGLSRIPSFSRKLLQSIARSNLCQALISAVRGRSLTKRQMELFALALDSRGSLAQLYALLRKRWRTTSILGDFENSSSSTDCWIDDYPIPQPYLCLMAIDALTFLPDGILVKVDRATMSVSLEARAPLLDHRVVDWLWRLPVEMRIRDGQGKWILRSLLERYLPRELYERPKQGFAVPIDLWLTNGLRPWAESLLEERRLKQEGFLNPTAVRAIWEAHLRGEHRAGFLIWPIVVFQAWLDDTQVATSAPSQSVL
jgi:asparagine synthase (glutamine-hydrolysing)